MAALAAALTLAAAAPPAGAAISSASIDGTTATLNLDGADDNVTVSVSAGLLVHSGTGAGLESTADWASEPSKVVTVPADGTFDVVVNGGDGNDTLTVLGNTNAIAGATLNGEGGDDFLAGSEASDALNGGDGNDTLVGRQGTDVMSGGDGNDTFVWNNGDGSDRQDGNAGDDTTEVNGSAALGDTFTLDPVPGGVRFLRTNLVPFKIDAATERFQVNGLGGDDSVTAADGLGALLSVDGGDGADTISGSGGSDVILGGDGNDVLTGGGGRDTIDGGSGDDQVDVRDNSADVATGGDGTDTAVADSSDLDVLDGFEVVERPPIAMPPPVVDPPPVVEPPPVIPPAPMVTPPAQFLVPPNGALPPLVTIRSRTARVTGGRASIKVACPATPAGACVGRLTLVTPKRVTIAGRKLVLELGSTRYDLRPGATATLRVKLRRASRQLADRNGRLKVIARATTSVSGAAAQRSHRLTLALGRSISPTHQ